MNNITQGFTLVELLIVIAIIGILAAALIPNLIGAQRRAYDTGAQSCAKSVQVAEVTNQIDSQTYFTVAKAAGATAITGLPATAQVSNGCLNTNMIISSGTSTGSAYSFVIGDQRGKNTYTVTAYSMVAI